MLRESSGGAKNDRWFDSSYDCNLYVNEDNSSAQPSPEDCKHVGQCAEGEGFCDVKFTAELERAHETGHGRRHCEVVDFAALFDGATYVCYAPREPCTPNNLRLRP